MDLEIGEKEGKLPAIEKKRLRQKIIQLGKDEESLSTELDENSPEGELPKEEVKQDDKTEKDTFFERWMEKRLKKKIRKRGKDENNGLDGGKKDGGGQENKNRFTDDLIENEFIDEKINKISKECEDEEKIDKKSTNVYTEN